MEEKKEKEQQDPVQEEETAAVPAVPEEEQEPPEGRKKEKSKEGGFRSKKADKEKEELQRKLEELQKSLDRQKDQLLRTAAEYDNYRKRTDREKDALYAAALADAVKEFLPVADNLERALAQEECSAGDLRKGVEMVYTQMRKTLEKLNVEEMGAVGEPFNPDLHNAVSHIEDEELGENIVAQVYQKGYRIGDRVVRHATVVVSN